MSHGCCPCPGRAQQGARGEPAVRSHPGHTPAAEAPVPTVPWAHWATRVVPTSTGSRTAPGAGLCWAVRPAAEQVLGICLEDDAWEGGVCPWRQAPGPAGRGTWPWHVAVAACGCGRGRGQAGLCGAVSCFVSVLSSPFKTNNKRGSLSLLHGAGGERTLPAPALVPGLLPGGP